MKRTPPSNRPPLPLPALGWPTSLLAALLLGAAAVPSAFAQRPSPPQILGTYNKLTKPESLELLALRPNVTQVAYLYVKAPRSARIRGDYNVRLLWLPPGRDAKPEEVAKGIVKGLEPGGDSKLIGGWTIAPPPQPEAGAPAAVKPPPLDLARSSSDFAIELTSTREGAKPILARSFNIAIVPAAYLKTTGKLVSDGTTSRIEFTITPTSDFHGPACPVQLDLSGLGGRLLPGVKGVLASKLKLDKKPVVLKVENLRFAGAAPAAGRIGLTVDGLNWTQVFVGDFSTPTTAEGADLQPIAQPQLGVFVDLPRCDTAAATTRYCSLPPKTGSVPVDVKVYTPSATSGAVSTWFEYNGNKGEVVDRDTTHDQHIYLSASKTDGELLFQTEARDWILNVPAPTGNGVVDLMARLAVQGKSSQNEQVEILFNDQPPHDIQLSLDVPDKNPKIVLDGKATPVLFRGQPLVLRANAIDPTGIASAYFYLGQLPEDNKLPPDAVRGKQVTQGGRTFWQATLPLPAKQVPGPLTVGVLMTDEVKLSNKDEVIIILREPPLPATDAIIEGDVVMGDLAQPNLRVQLVGNDNKPKATAKTDAAGHYIFKHVIPGAYTVTAEKLGGAHDAKAVEVVAGEHLEGVDLRLLR